MSDRVLNFQEFSKKYSGGKADLSLDDLTASAEDFEKGFDDSTYDTNQMGPNRQVAGTKDVTPPQPGEEGTEFNTDMDVELDAPKDIEETPAEIVEPDDDEGDDAEETPESDEVEDAEPEDDTVEDDDDEDSEDDDDEDDVPEPEAGANPKIKIIKESNQSTDLMSFDKFFESLATGEDDESSEEDEECDCGKSKEECDCGK